VSVATDPIRDAAPKSCRPRKKFDFVDILAWR